MEGSYLRSLVKYNDQLSGKGKCSMKMKYEVPVAEFISFGDEIITSSVKCQYHTGWHDVVVGPFDVCEEEFGSYTDNTRL